MIERSKQHKAANLDVPGARRHRRQHRHDRSEVAVVDEMMLGGPDRVEARLVQIFDLLEHGGIKVGVAKLRQLGWVAKPYQITEFDHTNLQSAVHPLSSNAGKSTFSCCWIESAGRTH